MATFRGRHQAPIRNLDGPQKPGIFHVGQTTQLQAGPVVTLSHPIRFPPPSQTWQVYGQTRCTSQRADHGTGTDDNSNIMLLTPKLFAVCMLEGLEFAGLELNILHDICKGIKNPAEEPIAKAAVQLRKSSTRSLHSREWSNRDGLLYFHSQSMYPQTPISVAALFPCAMTQRWPGTLEGSKPWNWCPLITGGPTCHGTLASMCRPATYAFRQRPNAAYPQENFSCSQSWKATGRP
jgi:hypothetical protein